MDVLKVIATVLLVLFEVFLIVVVLLQTGKSAGLSASIGGSSTDNFFGKHKSRSFEGRMQRLTTISAIGFIILSIVLVILK